MTSSGNGPPAESPTTSSFPTIEVRKVRLPSGDESPEVSTTSLPLRTASPPTIASRTGTLSSVLSRSSSPNGRLSLSLSRFSRSPTASPLGLVSDGNDETRTLFVRSFSPTVAICASAETDELARRKGFKKGFADLIRPYGERITGKVVVRDSAGASRSWDDFGVRFLELDDIVQALGSDTQGTLLENLEELLDQYLEQNSDEDIRNGVHEISPYHRLLLARLLSSQPPSQHEVFLHPVATVIAISSSTPSPIETLRNLYSQTAQGSLALPPYANPEYLRYYALVHDDDNDDFAKSSALFDQMKRHFGLHCHLLRIRSAHCSPDDEDAEEVPQCEWITTSTELSRLQETTQLIEFDANSEIFVFSSDAAAVRIFVRELVAQSIVPYMEQRISMWNEQIASRRRGISGRFMSLSKRWGGIGGLGSSRSTSSTNLSSSGSSGNYDSLQSYYRWDTPEALLRKLADFAIMLRDYKLAASTYDMLRTDYSNDKAWKYLAGANEMCCVANLLNPLLASSGSSSSSKSLPKLETFDQMLEAASYSYLTRCNEPALAMRTILVVVELLKVRGRLASELASKWAIQVLELNLAAQGSISHVLVSERVASCLAGHQNQRQPNSSGPFLAPRKRKAALWSVTAAEEWMKLGRAKFAASRIEEAQEMYSDLKYGDAVNEYVEMAEFMQQLQLAIRMKLGQARRRGASGASATGHLIEPERRTASPTEVETEIEETTEEQMETLDTRRHRRTMTNPQINIGGGDVIPPMSPLSPVRLNRPDPFSSVKTDDDFE